MAAKPVFEVYQDRGGEWRWRLVASNGNIVADSAEGYASKQGAKRGIRCVKRIAPDAEVEETKYGPCEMNHAPNSMELTVYGPLRSATGEKRVRVDPDGETVRAVVEAFVAAYPRAESHLVDEAGDLRP